MAKYLKLARFDHYIKQLFIVPGIFAAIIATNINWMSIDYAALILALVATCFIASANYIINEYLDAKFDKFHPLKKERSSVKNNLNPVIVFAMYAIFAILGLIFALCANFLVFASAFVLLIFGILYNVPPIRTKDIEFLDVISESFNNALRLLIGWFAISTAFYPPVTIILGYWLVGAFLMALKRYTELMMIGDLETAKLYRKSFKGYTPNSLLVSAFAYALMSFFMLSIFLIKYKIELLVSIPFICVIYCWYFVLALNKDTAIYAPEKIHKKKWFICYIALTLGVILALLFLEIPNLSFFLEKTPILVINHF